MDSEKLQNSKTWARVTLYKAWRHSNLDFNKVDRFHETRLSSQYTGIEAASGCRDDLPSSTMNSISVQCYIVQVKTHGSHVLLTQYALATTNRKC